MQESRLIKNAHSGFVAGEEKLKKLADLGFAITQEQMDDIPYLAEVCNDIVTCDAVAKDEHFRTAGLNKIWDAIEEGSNLGSRNPLPTHTPQLGRDPVCLRDAKYRSLTIAPRGLICDIVNRRIPLRGNLISNGCYWLSLDDYAIYLVWRTCNEVSIMAETYFGGNLLEELMGENGDHSVMIEEPSTGKRYTGCMSDIRESTDDPLFVTTNGEHYVISDCTAAVECFSDSAWEDFCEGYNPRT